MTLAKTTLSLLLAALAASPALSHWVLEQPPSLGFDDAKEATAPCGGMDPKNRTTVTNWPVGGYPVSMLTTHSSATWSFRMALASNPTMFMDLQPNVTQTGLGHVCLTVKGMVMKMGSGMGGGSSTHARRDEDEKNVYKRAMNMSDPGMAGMPGMNMSGPGMANMTGQDAIVQIIQHAADGALYQCAAVKFVPGDAMMAPSTCMNSSGVAASFAAKGASGGSSNGTKGSGSGGGSSGGKSAAAGGMWNYFSFGTLAAGVVVGMGMLTL